MEAKRVNNILVSDLAKQYKVSRSYIFDMIRVGKTDSEIIYKLESLDIPLKQVFLKYVQVYLKLVLFYFDLPEERKRLKQEYFTKWEEIGLPISLTRLENGWSKIVRGAY